MQSLKSYFFYLFILLPFINFAQEPFDYEKTIDDNQLYKNLNIGFQNDDDEINLEGTLIIPKKEFSQIILIIPGSDRNTRFAHHKLAQKFLEDNIGVFRFDDRGVGMSEGRYNPFDANSLASDIIYAIKKLKLIPDLEEKQIGVLGHSLGAIAAIKATSKTDDINYIIQLSAPVKNPSHAFRYQAVNNLNGQYNYKDKSKNQIEHLIDTLTQIARKNFKNDNYKEVYKEGNKAIKTLNFKTKNVLWTYSYIDLIKDNLDQGYKDLNIPLLYLIGSEDKYVDPNNEIVNISAYENSYITYNKLEGLNHYFLNEKATLENLYEIDENVTDIILEWIKNKDKNSI